MALVPCPDCGREVSTIAVSCPGCGRPMGLPVAAAALPILSLWIFGYPAHMRNRSQAAPNRFGLALGSTLVLALGFAVGVGLGSKLDVKCSVRGTGETTCSFVSLGIMPGRSCVVVKLSNDVHVPIASEKSCSPREARGSVG